MDRLLREGVFVDLLRVVRQSLRASVESYSIKRLEPFYGFTREIDLRDAGSSIVAFEEWLAARRRRAPGRVEPRSHRGLQPRRRPQQLPASRLARGSGATNSRELTGGPIAHDRCLARTRCPPT